MCQILRLSGLHVCAKCYESSHSCVLKKKPLCRLNQLSVDTSYKRQQLQCALLWNNQIKTTLSHVIHPFKKNLPDQTSSEVSYKALPLYRAWSLSLSWTHNHQHFVVCKGEKKMLRIYSSEKRNLIQQLPLGTEWTGCNDRWCGSFEQLPGGTVHIVIH